MTQLRQRPVADADCAWEARDMAAADVEVVRRLWAAALRSDVAELTALLAADVRWYGVGEEDGGCHGRDEALAFTRRALSNGVTAEAIEVRDAGDHVVVVVQTRHPAEWGSEPAPHGEVVTVHDGKVVEMVVHPDVDGALAAAGLRHNPDATPELGRPLRQPLIELLFFDGCPGHERLLPTVERLAEEAGAALRLRKVDTLELAESERFLGSPTVRVDGADVDPTASERKDFGLKCRIYRSDEGQSGVPPERWIRAALGLT